MQLKDYIQGDRHGKEANRLERKAMNDKFLQDALDGFDAVPYDHAQVIERLEKRVAATPQNKRNVFFYGSIAASILLLIGFGVYFLSERNEINKAIVMLQPGESEMENRIIPQSPALSEQSEAPESKMPEEQREQTYIVDIVEDNLEVDPVINIEEEELLINENTSHISIKYVSEQAMEQITVESSVAAVSVEEQEEAAILNLMPDTQALSKVVVADYGTQKKEVSEIDKSQRGVEREEQVIESDNVPTTFGKKEFQAYCRQKADKNVCEGKKVTVKVSFFIDQTGKPTHIKCSSYTCENAKKEIENLLSSSPLWTTVNKKVTMTVKW